MSYTVYKHTSPSGKVYVGITGRKPSRRFHGGSAYRNNPHFFNAIKKYGWDSFSHDIIAEGLSKEQACELEMSLIAVLNATDPAHGYNRSRGGDKTTLGYRVSDETKAKISAKALGRKNPHTPEWNAKIGDAHRGRKASEETKAKLRECLGERFSTPAAIAKQRANTPRGAKHPRAKMVVCVETAEVFPTMSEAAKKYNTSRTNIGHALNGDKGQALAGGYHWRYATPEEVDEAER